MPSVLWQYVRGNTQAASYDDIVVTAATPESTRPWKIMSVGLRHQ